MNFGSCVKVSILSLVLSTAAYIPAGMANTQSNPAETLERFQNERPDAKYYSVDSENADLTLSAIAGIYARTTNITDIYVEKVNAHSDFAQLVASREVLGEEEYKKAVESLSAEEKAEYDEYLNSNYSILAESIQLIPEVQNLNQGISSLDPKDLASSPLRIRNTAKSLNHAKDQLSFTADALSVLESHYTVTRNARNSVGR